MLEAYRIIYIYTHIYMLYVERLAKLFSIMERKRDFYNYLFLCIIVISSYNFRFLNPG